jgi:transposase-like protein
MGKHLSVDRWAVIERQYRDGATAKALAAEHGVPASTVYKRASREGWRADVPGDPMSTLDRLDRLASRLERAIWHVEGMPC